MIIGDGLIASAFRPYYETHPDILLFASGTANSRETEAAIFLREQLLLENALSKDRFLIYFSTCSIDDPELKNSPYVIHKLAMEKRIQSSTQYAIFRLPQVVGKTSNPHTLTNYLYRHIVSDSPFEVWRYAKRNLIDIDDVVSIVIDLIQLSEKNRITESIACPFSINAIDLVSLFECILNKKAIYTFKEAGSTYTMDTPAAIAAAQRLSIDFNEQYIEKLIRKYYAS